MEIDLLMEENNIVKFLRVSWIGHAEKMQDYERAYIRDKKQGSSKNRWRLERPSNRRYQEDIKIEKP